MVLIFFSAGNLTLRQDISSFCRENKLTIFIRITKKNNTRSVLSINKVKLYLCARILYLRIETSILIYTFIYGLKQLKNTETNAFKRHF